MGDSGDEHEVYLPAPSWIRKEAERHGWLRKESEVQAEIDSLKLKNSQMGDLLDYIRRACQWTGSESMIVMSIKREIDRFDHEILKGET